MLVLFLFLVSPSWASREEMRLEPPEERSVMQAVIPEGPVLPEAAGAGDMLAQRPASGSFQRDEAAVFGRMPALLEIEYGMTEGNVERNGHYSTPPPSDNMFVNFFNKLVALCTNVEADEYEIEFESPMSLEMMLGQFPKDAVYISDRGTNLIVTADRAGNEPIHLGLQFGSRVHFKVSEDPFISGPMIRAKADVWFENIDNAKKAGFLTGYVTLFDSDGEAATPVFQTTRKWQTSGIPKQLAGDSQPPVEVEWGSERIQLGHGSFGQVFKTTIDLDDGKGPIPVAQKVPFHNDQAYFLLKEEIKVMQDVAKVDEVKWQAVQLIYASQNPLTLAIELSPFGDLFRKIKRFRQHPSCFWRILRQISWVFTKMPKLNHRDIKPENILLFPSKDKTQVNFKLADFGLATNNGQYLWGGTAKYMPPEARTPRKVVNRQADVFALGLTILNMVLGDATPGLVNLKGCDQRKRTQPSSQGLGGPLTLQLVSAKTKNVRCTWQDGTKLIYQGVETMIMQYSRAFPDTGGMAHLTELAKLIKLMTHPDDTKRITFEVLDDLLEQYRQSQLSDLTCPIDLMS